MSIGNRIRQARQRKGYSQEYVAELLDLSQGGYRKIEIDEVKLKVDTLLLLSRIFEVEVATLLHTSDVKHPLTWIEEPNQLLSTVQSPMGWSNLERQFSR